MAREPETLTDLVAARVGPGTAMTYRKFEERAIDPVSGHKPSLGVLWKVAKGERVIIDPELVRAVAAGIGLPEERVQAAAAYQYTGLVATEVAGGYVIHAPAVGGDTAASERAVQEQRAREAADGD
jgi:hypothetical protein